MEHLLGIWKTRFPFLKMPLLDEIVICCCKIVHLFSPFTLE